MIDEKDKFRLNSVYIKINSKEKRKGHESN